MRSCRSMLPLLAMALVALPGVAMHAYGQGCPSPISGKVYTSLPCNVSNSNHNIYTNPCDVYLSAGPSVQGNCGVGSGLPDGTYYFQVTDPDGTTLLSTDSLAQRTVTITNGLMSAYLGSSSPCVHLVDSANSCQNSTFCPGQIAVQLMPFSPTPNSGGEYKVWVTPVTCYNAANANNPKKNFGFDTNNSATDNYKVLPSTPLGIQCPSNIDQPCDGPGVGGAVVNFPDPTVSGGVPPITVTCSPASGSFFPVGTTTVTCTASDFTGATVTCTFTVTVDTCPPAKCDIVCPDDVNQCAPDDACSATLDPGTATPGTGCHIVGGVRSDNLALTDPYPVGTTTITWTATDNATGTITAQCIQTIVIKSGKLAVFTNCPSDASYECLSDVPGVAVNPAAVDGCTGDPLVVTYVGETGNDGTNCQTITRTWSATTECRGTVYCVQHISVSDTTAPVLSDQPQDVSYQCYADVLPAPPITAVDNCDGNVTVDFQETQTNQGSSCNNVIKRTWSAHDSCNNPVSYTQTITVNDNTAPVLSDNPKDATYECIDQVGPAQTLTANDNCDGPVDVSFDEKQSNPGSSCHNTITRTWSAKDKCGNPVSYTQTITVNDDQAPVISGCPTGPIVVQGNGANGCLATVTLPTLTATDNCDGPVPVSGVRSDGKPLSDPFSPGTTTVTYTAQDKCGNPATPCIVTVKVLGCATRTQGFWSTHVKALQSALANGCFPTTGCFVSPLTINELEALMWAQIGKNGSKARSPLGQAKLQLAQQLVAAYANCCILGTCPVTFNLSDAAALLNGTNINAIKALIDIVTAFNQSGDPVNLTPAQQTAIGGNATSQYAQSLATKNSSGVIDPGSCYY